MLPEDNTLSDYNYEVKKILCPISLDYIKYVHALMIAYYIRKTLRIELVPV